MSCGQLLSQVIVRDCRSALGRLISVRATIGKSVRLERARLLRIKTLRLFLPAVLLLLFCSQPKATDVSVDFRQRTSKSNCVYKAHGAQISYFSFVIPIRPIAVVVAIMTLRMCGSVGLNKDLSGPEEPRSPGLLRHLQGLGLRFEGLGFRI